MCNNVEFSEHLRRTIWNPRCCTQGMKCSVVTEWCDLRPCVPRRPVLAVLVAVVHVKRRSLCKGRHIFATVFCVLWLYPSIFSGDTAVNKGSCPFSLVVSATSGYEMYAMYCAGCHGEDGRGTGRSARYCTVPPADLTQLARKNHDTYPSESVCQILRYGTGRPATGRGTCLSGAPTRTNECRPSRSYGGANSESLRVCKDSAGDAGRSKQRPVPVK